MWRGKVFCCQGFENLVANAGERGVSVVISRKPGGFRFDFQSRAVAQRDEVLLSERWARTRLSDEIKELQLGDEIKNVTLATSIVLSFCPFCGTSVRKLFRPSTLRSLSDLAERHSKYFMGVS